MISGTIGGPTGRAMLKMNEWAEQRSVRTQHSTQDNLARHNGAAKFAAIPGPSRRAKNM